MRRVVIAFRHPRRTTHAAEASLCRRRRSCGIRGRARLRVGRSDAILAARDRTRPELADVHTQHVVGVGVDSEPVDDRPWVTAHGNGHVFYFGNEGDKETYGPGRYTVYQSYDGGQTFNPLGLTLPDSGWCRPAADHRPGSPYVYAFCTNDEGTLYSYVSSDDGQTFARYVAGTYAADDSTQSWPAVEVAPDGSVWALYVDGKLDANGDPVTNRLRLFHSTDHGKTWTQRDITPLTGRYEYGWLDVSADGKSLGFGVYYRPDNNSDWHVYGSVFRTGAKPTLTLLDPVPVQEAQCFDAPGDLMGSSFGPNGTLSVVWTRITLPDTCGLATIRDIYYARSLAG